MNFSTQKKKTVPLFTNHQQPSVARCWIIKSKYFSESGKHDPVLVMYLTGLMIQKLGQWWTWISTFAGPFWSNSTNYFFIFFSWQQWMLMRVPTGWWATKSWRGIRDTSPSMTVQEWSPCRLVSTWPWAAPTPSLLGPPTTALCPREGKSTENPMRVEKECPSHSLTEDSTSHAQF